MKVGTSEYETKKREVMQFSHMPTVLKKLKEHGYDPASLLPSTRKSHKWSVMVDGKKVHFGAMFMQDYTKHKDEERRRRFQSRNKKWATAPFGTPAHLSYFTLW